MAMSLNAFDDSTPFPPRFDSGIRNRQQIQITRNRCARLPHRGLVWLEGGLEFWRKLTRSHQLGKRLGSDSSRGYATSGSRAKAINASTPSGQTLYRQRDPQQNIPRGVVAPLWRPRAKSAPSDYSGPVRTEFLASAIAPASVIIQPRLRHRRRLL